MEQNRKLVRAERADGVKSRHAILNAAASLATVEGLDGLSIGRLAEHVGMSKSGLYAHFGSKEELQLATIETANGIFQEAVIGPTLSVEDPVERIEALCNAFLYYLERRLFPGGCFFASVAAEYGSHPGAVRERIAGIQGAWMSMLAELGESAQALGLIDPREDPKQLAFEVQAYLLLANMAFVLDDNPLALERARKAVHGRLNLARTAAKADSSTVR
jgi:AcrR family transcriptional regulator